MTNFSTHVAAGPVISSLASKEKGSMGNRIDCAGAQVKNKVQNTIETAGVLGGTGAAYKLATNMTKGKEYKWNATINNSLKKYLKQFADYVQAEMRSPFGVGEYLDFTKGVTTAGKKRLISQHGKFKGNIAKFAFNMIVKTLNLINKGATALSKTSGRQKVLGAIILTGLGLFTYVQKKHSYQAGQIDQKYTDKAQTQKVLEK